MAFCRLRRTDAYIHTQKQTSIKKINDYDDDDNNSVCVLFIGTQFSNLYTAVRTH